MTGNFDKDAGCELLRQIRKDLEELAYQAENNGCGEAGTTIDAARHLLFQAMIQLKGAN